MKHELLECINNISSKIIIVNKGQCTVKVIESIKPLSIQESRGEPEMNSPGRTTKDQGPSAGQRRPCHYETGAN